MRGTGFLLVDGSDALGRAPAVPRHWFAAAIIVIVFQWVVWQGQAVSEQLALGLIMPPWFGSAVGVQVWAALLSLVLPTGVAAALALHFSRRFDGRGASALGLDFMTAPTAAVWTIAGLIAAGPVLAAIIMRQPDLSALTQGLVLLTPTTIVQAGAEEIVFRGVILASLAARYGAGAGLVIGAVLFGLWHVSVGQNLVDCIVAFSSTFVFGLSAGLLTLHYGNLGPALALHVVWNVAGYLRAGFVQWEMDFWPAWLESFYQPWTYADVLNGDVLRFVGAPLALETLLVLVACRETLFRLAARPRRAAA